MKPAIRNLFADADPPEHGERFEPLWSSEHALIERIVSSDTPDTTAYDQPNDECVVLLRGSATLEIDGVEHALGEGDHVYLPARTPHRVLETSNGAVWLAVHLGPR